MRKSDIRYPRATADLGPAEGHAATKIIKCQARGNMQREEMWPTWHNHTSLCHCPERGFSSIRQADWPDRQERYGYFPWQPAEPAGILKRGGQSCDVSQERHLFHCKYGSLSSTKANFALSFLFSEMNQCVQGSSPLLYANATICLTRSKISTKVVCVHLSARPSARVQWEANILKWGQTPKQVECISPAEHWSKRRSYDLFPVSSVSSRSCDLYLSIRRQERSFSLPHLAFTHPEKG